MNIKNIQPQLTIDIGAIKKNYLILKDFVSPSVCAAVVKDNAYGLGMKKIVSALSEAGCEVFFVAYAVEGAELRAMQNDATIYLLQGIGQEDITLVNTHQLIPVISTLDQFFFWEKNGNKFIKPAIQIETGLNRLGLTQKEISSDSFQKIIQKTELSLILSHLSCANEAGHFMNHDQLNQFKVLTDLLPKAPLSLSASDGAFLGKTFHYDMIRAGAALYGINTAPYRENPMNPVIFIQAPILKISNISGEQYVGYGATYKTHGERKIATLSIGYGDGLPRHLRNKGKVWFKNAEGQRYAAPMVGAISMDMITCDVTHIPEDLVSVGAMASITDVHYTIDDLAKDADTIGYEIITRLGHRFIRNYSNSC